MSVVLEEEVLLSIILLMIGFHVLYQIFNNIIFPKLVEKTTTEIERNPKWIMSECQEYGFQDIDIVLVESRLNCVPRVRVAESGRYELLVDKEVTTSDAPLIARLALAGKIRAKYGLSFSHKPVYWLSLLCYMLDGGEIKQDTVMWEKKQQ